MIFHHEHASCYDSPITKDQTPDEVESKVFQGIIGEPSLFFQKIQEIATTNASNEYGIFIEKIEEYIFAYKQVSSKIEGIAFCHNDSPSTKINVLMQIYHNFDGVVTMCLGDLDSEPHKISFGEQSLEMVQSHMWHCFKQCMLFTRDKRNGYGMRDVSYALLLVWYKYFPKDAIDIMKQFVFDLGSWADIKYFCDFCKNCGEQSSKECIFQVLQIMTNQLYLDVLIWNAEFESYLENRRQFFFIPYSQPRKPLMHRPCARKLLSLVAKWVPRENSKYGWLYDSLVLQWAHKNKYYKMKNNKHLSFPNNHIMNCLRGKFRKIVSRLNRELDTVEIKLCSNQLDEIHIPLVPKECFRKNMIGFLTGFGSFLKKYNGETAYFWDYFLQHPEDIQRYFLPKDFVHFAVVFHAEKHIIPPDFFLFLNVGWKTLLASYDVPAPYRELNHSILPAVEVLFDNTSNHLYESITLGILLAQKNMHRFVLSNHFFNWVVAAPDDNLTDIIDRILGFLKNPIGKGYENTINILSGACGSPFLSGENKQANLLKFIYLSPENKEFSEENNFYLVFL